MLHRIINSSTAVSKLAYYLQAKMINTSVKIRSRYNSIKYGAKINPFNVILVNPYKIRQAMEPFDCKKHKIAGAVRGGDWDKRTVSFDELKVRGEKKFDVYESIERHFSQGVPWEETKLYRNLVEEVDKGKHWWGCSSIEDITKRLNSLDKLYADICENGYKSQKEIEDDIIFNKLPDRRRGRINKTIQDEVAINIGRSGELIFYDGRNRLSIARVLGLEKIPVTVLLRHKQWEEFRKHVKYTYHKTDNISDDIISHPDIMPLIRS